LNIIAVLFSFYIILDITVKNPRKHPIVNALIRDLVLASLSSLKYPYLIEVSCIGFTVEVEISSFICIVFNLKIEVFIEFKKLKKIKNYKILK
jgi:hypothetical protein